MDVLQHDTGSVGIDTGQWRESSAIPSSFETGHSHVLFTRTAFSIWYSIRTWSSSRLGQKECQSHQTLSVLTWLLLFFCLTLAIWLVYTLTFWNVSLYTVPHCLTVLGFWGQNMKTHEKHVRALVSKMFQSKASRLRLLLKRSLKSKSKRLSEIKCEARKSGWKIYPKECSAHVTSLVSVCCHSFCRPNFERTLIK